MKSRLAPESFGFIILLGVLSGLTPLSVDMGLPALDAIGTSLHVSSNTASYTLSLFLVGFSVGPVFLGPLSDRFGRRPVLMAGSAIFVVAAIGCVVAQNIYMLLLCRVIQGIGGGTGYTLSMAVIRDLFDGAAARVRLSYITTIFTLAPIVAPTIGGLILHFANWRYIYALLTIAGIITFILVYFLYEESNRSLNPLAIEPRRFRDNYLKVFTNETCLGYILVNSVSFGCMFSYIACSPLVMMGLLGISETNYGWTFAATGVSVMSSAALNAKLSSQGVSSRTLLQFGLWVSCLSALGLVVIAFTLKPSLISILPLLVVNVFSAGFIAPNAAQATLHPVPEIAGVASAAISSSRMLFGAISGLVAATLFDGQTAKSMAIFMAVLSCCALALYWHVNRAHQRLLAG